jgi:alcohol dehydrogenase class IV
MPALAVVDPELTLSCPPAVTASAGMDALAQAIESFLSVHAVPTTEALSLRAAGMVAGDLPTVYRDGRNAAARATVAEGSFMAGLALGSARLGAVHGLAHPLGLIYELAHGVVCAVLLPHVLRMNAPAAPAKYELLTDALGKDPIGLAERLLEELDLPRTLGPYPDEAGERAVLDYVRGSGSAAANPVELDDARVLRLLEDATD